MLKNSLAVILFLFLAGCASHKPSMYSINGEDVFIGWNNQSKLPKNAYYVLIEGDKDGNQWTVKEIYNKPIKGRSNELQEVLFVDPNFAYVQPYFEINETTKVKVADETTGTPMARANSNGQMVITGTDYHRRQQYYDRGSWECGYLMKNNEDKYTQCNSRLTMNDVGKSIGKNLVATVLTAGLASGTHKVVDKEKVAAIITQTNLFEQIKKSEVYKPAQAAN